MSLAAASPWSKRANETEGRALPDNVTARAYNYRELRDLYASASFVVVPLYETDFQAGVTTILEGEVHLDLPSDAARDLDEYEEPPPSEAIVPP